MPPICNINAVIQCPHQGGVAKLAPRQFVVNIGGAPALRATDMPGQPFLPGCPNLGSPGQVPCATIISPAMPASRKVFIQGQPALLSNGLMNSNGVPPVPNGVTVKLPGQITVIAAG
jgi:hypothetical protein